jgi:hypothetical protein
VLIQNDKYFSLNKTFIERNGSYVLTRRRELFFAKWRIKDNADSKLQFVKITSLLLLLSKQLPRFSNSRILINNSALSKIYWKKHLFFDNLN